LHNLEFVIKTESFNEKNLVTKR